MTLTDDFYAVLNQMNDIWQRTRLPRGPDDNNYVVKPLIRQDGLSLQTILEGKQRERDYQNLGNLHNTYISLPALFLDMLANMDYARNKGEEVTEQIKQDLHDMGQKILTLERIFGLDQSQDSLRSQLLYDGNDGMYEDTPKKYRNWILHGRNWPLRKKTLAELKQMTPDEIRVLTPAEVPVLTIEEMRQIPYHTTANVIDLWDYFTLNDRQDAYYQQLWTFLRSYDVSANDIRELDLRDKIDWQFRGEDMVYHSNKINQLNREKRIALFESCLEDKPFIPAEFNINLLTYDAYQHWMAELTRLRRVNQNAPQHNANLQYYTQYKELVDKYFGHVGWKMNGETYKGNKGEGYGTNIRGDGTHTEAVVMLTYMKDLLEDLPDKKNEFDEYVRRLNDAEEFFGMKKSKFDDEQSQQAIDRSLEQKRNELQAELNIIKNNPQAYPYYHGMDNPENAINRDNTGRDNFDNFWLNTQIELMNRDDNQTLYNNRNIYIGRARYGLRGGAEGVIMSVNPEGLFKYEQLTPVVRYSYFPELYVDGGPRPSVERMQQLQDELDTIKQNYQTCEKYDQMSQEEKSEFDRQWFLQGHNNDQWRQEKKNSLVNEEELEKIIQYIKNHPALYRGYHNNNSDGQITIENDLRAAWYGSKGAVLNMLRICKTMDVSEDFDALTEIRTKIAEEELMQTSYTENQAEEVTVSSVNSRNEGENTSVNPAKTMPTISDNNYCPKEKTLETESRIKFIIKKFVTASDQDLTKYQAVARYTVSIILIPLMIGIVWLVRIFLANKKSHSTEQTAVETHIEEKQLQNIQNTKELIETLAATLQSEPEERNQTLLQIRTQLPESDTERKKKLNEILVEMELNSSLSNEDKDVLREIILHERDGGNQTIPPGPELNKTCHEEMHAVIKENNMQPQATSA